MPHAGLAGSPWISVQDWTRDSLPPAIDAISVWDRFVPLEVYLLGSDGAAAVQIFDCSGQLCGRIAWLRTARDTAGRPAQLRARQLALPDCRNGRS